jgi:hypothetical protein
LGWYKTLQCFTFGLRLLTTVAFCPGSPVDVSTLRVHAHPIFGRHKVLQGLAFGFGFLAAVAFRPRRPVDVPTLGVGALPVTGSKPAFALDEALALAFPFAPPPPHTKIGHV